jgi:hypothetical protein
MLYWQYLTTMPAMDWGNLISGGAGSLIGALATWATQVLHSKRQARLEREAREVQDLTEQRDDLYRLARHLRNAARRASEEARKGDLGMQVAILDFEDGIDTTPVCALFYALAGQMPDIAKDIDDFHDICRRFRRSYQRAIASRQLLAGYRPEPLSELRDVEQAYERIMEALLTTGWKVPLKVPG